MVERPNVELYKVELYLLKIIPILLAGIHLANTVLSYYGIDIILFSYIGSVSLILLIFLYISSYVFKFCEYHRMFLHYIVVNNAINSSYHQAQDACAVIEEDKPNYGITYSNHILKTTILVISKSTSAKEFIDTFVHEVSHIQRHIIKTYHLDSDSEQVCYMIGTIAKRLYTKCSRLFCDDDY